MAGSVGTHTLVLWIDGVMNLGGGGGGVRGEL